MNRLLKMALLAAAVRPRLPRGNLATARTGVVRSGVPRREAAVEARGPPRTADAAASSNGLIRAAITLSARSVLSHDGPVRSGAVPSLQTDWPPRENVCVLIPAACCVCS
jgi:hypothetical protein